MRIARSVLVLHVLAVACAGAQSTPPADRVMGVPDSTPQSPPEESGPVAEAATSGTEPAINQPNSAPHAGSSAEAEPNAARDVTYLVTPEGLKVSVAGVKFSVGAVAIPIGKGFGVEVNVQASAVDGKPHSLTSPKGGPLAFAGSVLRRGQSEAERFADERVGDGELGIFGDGPSKFSRTWPPKSTRSLGIGDALDLQIALWGLGVEQDSRRPVKQFLRVRMQVARGKPRAIVEPPASASGR